MVFATTGQDGGGPAACLRLDTGGRSDGETPLGGEVLLTRLAGQLGELGVDKVLVLTRPAWVDACAAALRSPAVRSTGATVSVRATDTLSDALGDVARTVHEDCAADQRAEAGRVLLLDGHVLVHRGALAGLLRNPRLSSGALLTRTIPAEGSASALRTARGRVVSAGSGYHRVRAAHAASLGVVLVGPADRPALATAAQQLAALCPPKADPADPLVGEGDARRASAGGDRILGHLDDRTSGDSRSEFARTAGADLPALLLVGLVRANAPITAVDLRRLFLARPTSAASLSHALVEMAAIDEDRVLLDSAVKASDGFFTTFFVSPYSRYLARWAARRGWTPNAVTTLSMGLGALAAASFATGSRWGLVVGAVLLQVAFTADCVDGQMARYTQTFSALGAWLDSVFDRAKEYLVYAGLAVGSLRGFHDDVWLLATAALVLQTVRHSVDFSYAAAQHRGIAAVEHPPLHVVDDVEVTVDGEVAGEAGPGEPVPIDLARPRPAAAPVLLGVGAASGGGTAGPESVRGQGSTAPVPTAVPQTIPAPPTPARTARAGSRAIRLSRYLEHRGWMRYGKKILVLPIGERFALISLTAAVGTPRFTFVALLGWGAVAAAYSLTGKSLRSLAR